jgi:hypothetical protein
MRCSLFNTRPLDSATLLPTESLSGDCGAGLSLTVVGYVQIKHLAPLQALVMQLAEAMVSQERVECKLVARAPVHDGHHVHHRVRESVPRIDASGLCATHRCIRLVCDTSMHQACVRHIDAITPHNPRPHA